MVNFFGSESEPRQDVFSRLSVAFTLSNKRMADKGGIYPMAPVKSLFKGKHHRHMIDSAGDYFYPSFAPRPYLRADVVKNRNAQCFSDPRQTQIKIRESRSTPTNSAAVLINASLEQIGRRAKHF